MKRIVCILLVFIFLFSIISFSFANSYDLNEFPSFDKFLKQTGKTDYVFVSESGRKNVYLFNTSSLVWLDDSCVNLVIEDDSNIRELNYRGGSWFLNDEIHSRRISLYKPTFLSSSVNIYYEDLGVGDKPDEERILFHADSFFLHNPVVELMKQGKMTVMEVVKIITILILAVVPTTLGLILLARRLLKVFRGLFSRL
ncbi:hypothetical protein SAMN02745883_02429 [Caminicella sporogenes DSM 14501]|uniref:Uncharacterized protein n=1 Tax=Caminicella sporogenes DSM 14501 TaxID=1121266 RepID=A0A1M6TSQ6_9FIRM|nr:hypothetical protein [Caminicella sporogenes]RKD23752.1 hypothetical protein BET04_11960 [Caminicella sporogenes]SHK59943.1 hypothetical protein SAMN02745883_02429 [Caminicella sporogenes DSM 14501]